MEAALRAPSREAPAEPRRWPIGRPRVLPWLGSIVDLGRDTLGFLTENARERGDLVCFHVLGRPIWQINHPDLIDEVVFRQGKHLDKGYGYRVLRALMGEGLITADHRTNRRHRPLVAPTMTRKVVPRWADRTVDIVDAWIDGAVGETLDAQRGMLDLARSITVRTVLGAEGVEHVRAARAIELVSESAPKEIWGVGRFLPRSVPTPTRRAMGAALAEFDRVVEDILATRERGASGEDDVLDALLAARDTEGRPLSRRALRDEVATLFLAGHETTARALAHALVLGRTHPESWRALVDEVDAVLGDRRPTWKDLSRLKRVRAHVLEVLRLRPPVWLIARSATAPLSVGGHTARPGDEVFVPIYVIHRDPRFFDDPDDFRPERWLDGLEARLPRFAFLPFGPPPRRCIGDQLSMMVIQLTLVRLAQRCRLALKGPEPELQVAAILRFGGPAPMAFGARA